jgi:hypothetical protein
MRIKNTQSVLVVVVKWRTNQYDPKTRCTVTCAKGIYNQSIQTVRPHKILRSLMRMRKKDLQSVDPKSIQIRTIYVAVLSGFFSSYRASHETCVTNNSIQAKWFC